MADAPARAAAALVIQEVVRQGRSLSALLPPALTSVVARDRALLQELCYGTLRWEPRLEFILRTLLKKPLKKKDQDLHALLLVGLYQLAFLSIPHHAAVSETVAAADHLGKSWARGLINGVLRHYQRESREFAAAVQRDETARLAHPRWLLEKLRSAWPSDWQAIAQANNERPPFALRVNTGRISRETYLAELQKSGINARPTRYGSSAVILDQPLPVEQLPGFFEGIVSVQDPAAQLAAELLDARPGHHVLDACAAPGGKTGHLLERTPELSLDAVDKEPNRLARVRENLDRLDVTARLIAADAGAPEEWWDEEPYDRILLDAPCSASGVIRRHPDIKSLRKPADIPELVTQQARLLTALWPLLKPGGMLLYATCSIFHEENAEQVRRFLAAHTEAVERPIIADWGQPGRPGRQILPGEDDMDGFYYACIAKA